jgi:hypothetical protein
MVFFTKHSSGPEHPKAFRVDSSFLLLYDMLAMIWAAAVHDISKCEAVELGISDPDIGDVGAGGSLSLPYKGDLSPCAKLGTSWAWAGEHCVMGPQHACWNLASARTASISNAEAGALSDGCGPGIGASGASTGNGDPELWLSASILCWRTATAASMAAHAVSRACRWCDGNICDGAWHIAGSPPDSWTAWSPNDARCLSTSSLVTP